MNAEERIDRIMDVALQDIIELAEGYTGLWWLSFVGEEGSRGVAIVEAVTTPGAVSAAWAHGCNPGGEIAPVPLPCPDDDDAEGQKFVATCRANLNRLMQRDELNRLGFGVGE